MKLVFLTKTTIKIYLTAGVAAVLLLACYPATEALTVVNNLPMIPSCQDPEGSACNYIMVYGGHGFATGPIAPGKSVSFVTNVGGLYIGGNPVSPSQPRTVCIDSNSEWVSLFNNFTDFSYPDNILTVSLQPNAIELAISIQRNGTVTPVFQTYETCTWNKVIGSEGG